MNRRTALMLLGAAGVAGIGAGSVLLRKSGGAPDIPAHPDGRLPWKNWSGNQVCFPEQRSAPADEDELREIVMASKGPVRAVGAGHSFTALVPTDTTLVSMDRMGGVKSVDLDKGEAIFGAGGRLAQLSSELAEYGAAFPNLPDINKQSLAGAISTATHGTGPKFTSMSGEITQMRLVAASGETLFCSPSENSDLFRAAQVSLGALGIVTEAGNRIVPSHNLVKETWVEDYRSLVGRAADLFRSHHSFEFYYVPFTDHCFGISHDPTDEPPTPIPANDDEALESLKELRDRLALVTPIRRQVGRSKVADLAPERVVNESWKVLSSAREMRFNEMEYHLPADVGLDVLDEVIRKIERHHRNVFFPIEVRYVRGEEAWLSPFEGGDRISIAVHAYYEDDYEPLFRDIEPIYRKAGGRPHWGKLHSLEASDLEALYPRWNDFLRIRREVDPMGKFINPFLAKVFGV